MRWSKIFLALALSGCVSSGTQVNESQLAGFKKGVTTEQDVRKALGKPQGVSTMSSGYRIIVYSGISASPFSGHGSSASFTFGPDGTMTQMTSTDTNTR